MNALDVYNGSSGDLTRRYYDELTLRGPVGMIALNLFRAQKCSARAKLYRGRGYKSDAYERKQWSLENLCDVLARCGSELGIRYGWKSDESTRFGEGASWVLYVDLPEGQVSFHSPSRGKGPDYPDEWCGQHLSPDRIIQFCDRIFAQPPAGVANAL